MRNPEDGLRVPQLPSKRLKMLTQRSFSATRLVYIAVKMPGHLELARLFTVLLGVDVKVAPRKTPGKPKRNQVVASYVDDHEAMAAVLLLDPGLAMSAGSALSMVSPEVALDAATTWRIPPIIFENLVEVANVLSGVVNRALGRRTRARDVVALPGALDSSVLDVMAKPKMRLDLDVVVAGYQSGSLALLVAR